MIPIIINEKDALIFVNCNKQPKNKVNRITKHYNIEITIFRLIFLIL